jgi:hypothetical protein
MEPSLRRGMHSRRRRAGLESGSIYGFLRPPVRHEEEQRQFLDRLCREPALRREYRLSLLIQMVVVILLLAAMCGLVAQSFVLLRKLDRPDLSKLSWMVPMAAALLGLIVGRRFLRLLGQYRRLRGD